MTNINDFIQWWEGFRSGINPANITKEHLDILDKKINSLVDLYDIAFPEHNPIKDDLPYVPWPAQPSGWPYIQPFQFPKITPDSFPRVPEIWCKQDQQYPRVGTPEGFGTPRHVN